MNRLGIKYESISCPFYQLGRRIIFHELLKDASILTKHQFNELSASPKQVMKNFYIGRFQHIAWIKMVNLIFLFDIQVQAA